MPDSSLFIPQLTPSSKHYFAPEETSCFLTCAAFLQRARGIAETEANQTSGNKLTTTCRGGAPGCSSLSIHPPRTAAVPGSSSSKHTSDALRNLEMAGTRRWLMLLQERSLHTFLVEDSLPSPASGEPGSAAAFCRRGNSRTDSDVVVQQQL